MQIYAQPIMGVIYKVLLISVIKIEKGNKRAAAIINSKRIKLNGSILVMLSEPKTLNGDGGNVLSFR